MAIRRGTDGNDVLTGTDEPDRLYGEAGADTLRGGKGGDSLYGGRGADVLEGGDDGDHLYGGPGADTLRGGKGLDYARYDESSAAVTVNLATGKGEGGDAEGDTLDGIGVVVGSCYADTLYGGDACDLLGGEDNSNDLSADWISYNVVLAGEAGNDLLAGGAGNDYLSGGKGADRLDGGPGIDRAGYFESEQAVTVDLGANTASGGEGDTLTSIENLSGSDYDDHLMGDSNANVLEGMWGGRYSERRRRKRHRVLYVF